ncbi:TonB-dependent receptor [Sandaracinobacteroides sp. A072]|uniref:TonB-dependent receptor n=1 Tax=Sandaracinobacteroides sp. A072 TaxID=3461146 RepID=UPI0040438A34
MSACKFLASLSGAAVTTAILSAVPAHAQQADMDVIIVTAQKVAADINDVPMSITAASGDMLTKMGVTDASQLGKIVPGFTYNETAYGTPVFTIRGIGFQETSLGASPAVSAYVDEVPIPFSAQTVGLGLDLERLEVLKGPQGTLFGSNSTGGALNYIAAKPTKDLRAGLDATYGSFNTVDLQGFVSTPVTDTLGVRVAARYTRGDSFQKSMTRPDDRLGQKDFLQGRIILVWEPSPIWRTTLNITAQRDRSDSLAPQYIAFNALNSGAAIPPGFINFPRAPEDNRVADWDAGVDFARNNRFYFGSLRNEIDIGENARITALTSLQRFKRYQPLEGDGTPFNNYRAESFGKIDTFYQELRLDGTIGRASYIIGANYEHDYVDDNTIQYYTESSSAIVFGVPLGPTRPNTQQRLNTYGVFANVDYDLTDQLTAHAGVRFTQANRRLLYGCGQDIDGTWADVSAAIQAYLNTLAGNGPIFTPVEKGGCGTIDQDTIQPGGATGTLNQNNISWRLGLDYKPTDEVLLYANVSRGYKAGSFPTLAAATTRQFLPVVQETVLAFEGGFKATLADGAIQANGAAFYYDYTNKQILGRIPDIAFGPLPSLVNVPESRIWGLELDVVMRPLPGLRIHPAVSYINSRLGDGFVNYDSFGQQLDFSGEPFPYTPEWQANVDAEYEFAISENLDAYVGGTMIYQGETSGAFGQYPILSIDAYTTFDARLGVASADGRWRFQLWARNLTDNYYWTAAYRNNDSINRFAGAPRTFGATLNFRY